jgi:hypothetical protein
MNEFIKYNLTLSQNSGDCWDTFLNALSVQFPEFAMYYENEFYFTEGTTQETIQGWIDAYECQTGEDLVYNKGDSVDITSVIRTVDPTIYENLQKDILWVNKTSGEIFTCIDNSTDANIWRGTASGKIIRPVPPADKFDFFGDNSSVAFYQLNGNALDVGGKYPGKVTGIKWTEGLEGQCALENKSGQIRIDGLPFDNDTEAVTVSAWVNWNKTNSTMPFGFNMYDLYCYNGALGFNTANGDVTGIKFTPYKKKWVYLTAVFRKGEVGEMYLNGELQIYEVHQRNFNASTAVIGSRFNIFGWGRSAGYQAFGKVERLRLFNRALTENDGQELAFSETEYIKTIGVEI